MEKKLGSINARGLRYKLKRQEMFYWLRDTKYCIYYIQEAHCTKESMHDWQFERGYQALLNRCSSKKTGIAILFNNSFNFQIMKTFLNPAGRFIICNLKTNEKCVTLANVYALSEDGGNFFNSFFGYLLDFNCEGIIIGGDFNLILDTIKDKKGRLARTHQNSLDVITAFCENEDLVDVWRVLNPDSARFTWQQKKICRPL